MPRQSGMETPPQGVTASPRLLQRGRERATAQGICQQRARAVTPVVFSLWENICMGYRSTQLRPQGKRKGGPVVSQNRKM